MEKEAKEEDKANAIDFLKKNLGLDPETVEVATRLPLSKPLREKLIKEKKTICRPILVRFKSLHAKFAVLKNLPNLQKATNGHEVRISNDVPLSLKPRYAMLEEEGKALRREDKNLRTRVIWDQDTFILQMKTKGDNPWTTCEGA